MDNSVERTELAPGFTISRVLTGLWQIADMERDGRHIDLSAAAGAMIPYVQAGFTTFDMADHYGSAEEIAGRFNTEQTAPAPVQFFTKWVPEPGPITRQQVRAAVQRSLDRMNTTRLDLLQFHTWSYTDPSWLDCLFYLQELCGEGLIRHLGLTNFDTAHLRIALHSGIEIVSNQVCFSLLDQRAVGAMTSLCLEHGIKLLAFGTLGGGFLTERWLGAPEPDWDSLDTWSQMKYGRFIREAGGWEKLQDVLRIIHNVAERHGVSMANVACRYILEQPAVGGIIIGARLGESQHIEDNLRLFSFSLDDVSHNVIDGALAELRHIPGDCGDEYRKEPFLTASGDLSHHLASFPTPYPTRQQPDGRTLALSGTPWEELAGYSRAVRRGNRINVSGTTSAHRSWAIGGDDITAQAHFVIDKIEGALLSLGACLEDVVRTRIYVRNMSDWEAVARVHGERFGHILPANTLVQAQLVGDGSLVEMEAEAVVDSG